MGSPTQEVFMQFDVAKPPVPEPSSYIPAFSIKRAVSVHVLRLAVVVWVAVITLRVFQFFVSSLMGI